MTTSCPHPSKRGFPTEREALARLTEILAAPRTIVLPSRAYECRCGFWHLAHSYSRKTVRPTPLIMAAAAARARAAAEGRPDTERSYPARRAAEMNGA